MITELRRQLDKHTADITELQDAFSVIEDDVFEQFCQQINVSNIRSGLQLNSSSKDGGSYSSASAQILTVLFLDVSVVNFIAFFNVKLLTDRQTNTGHYITSLAEVMMTVTMMMMMMTTNNERCCREYEAKSSDVQALQQLKQCHDRCIELDTHAKRLDSQITDDCNRIQSCM